MRCSIIIPTLRENENYLKLCIESIKKYQTIDHEIIVCTNNGPAWEVPIDGIKVVHNEAQGQCQAVNLGVKVTSNDYIMIIDDDFVFPSDWEKILEKLEGKEFLCGNLIESGKIGSSFIEHNCGRTPEEFNEEEFNRVSKELSKDEVRQGFGFPLLFKKSFWNKIGGYLESLDPWGSNADSFLEFFIMLAGVPLQQYHGSLFYHFQGQSGTFSKPEAQPYWQKNLNYFPQFFGFGRFGSPRIWSGEFIIPLDKLKFRPAWAKLENNEYIQPDESYNESVECPNCRYEYLKFRNKSCPKCNYV